MTNELDAPVQTFSHSGKVNSCYVYGCKSILEPRQHSRECRSAI